ncbi:MAG: DNA polymerase III subunit delta [Gammaproteobacteria bacterium]
MKIYHQQLASNLAKGLANTYIISGNETLLVEEAAELIRKAAAKQDFSERSSFAIEKNFPWQNLLSSAKNLSLFAEKKLLELHLSSVKLETTGSKFLAEYLKKPAADTILLIIAPKLEAGWQKITWIKTIEETGVFLQIWPIENSELPAWINQRLRSREIQASPNSCKLIAERVEGNLLAAAQEIEKLLLLYGPGKLEEEHVIAAVGASTRYNIFTLVDASLAGDARKVVTILHGLKSEGTEPILILWALGRELRTLLKIADAKKRGQSVDEACKNEQVFAKRLPIVKLALGRLRAETLAKLLKKTARLDQVLKGVIPGNIWQELQQITLALAGLKYE